MKKKFFRIVASVLLVGLLLLFNFSSNNLNSNNGSVSLKDITSIAEAKAYINPDCPNGCIECGPGCYCYGWWPCLLEYDWGD